MNIAGTLLQHKKLVSEMAKTQNYNLLVPIVKTGEEICLVMADFMCQRCKHKKRLQFHHLIKRSDAAFIRDKIRYTTQRHYWANIIILCDECHNEYHNFRNVERDEKAFISEEKINKIRNKYKNKNEKGNTEINI